MAEQPSLFDPLSWPRVRFGEWIHHDSNAHSERRIARWLTQPCLLWLHSSEPVCGKSHLVHEICNNGIHVAMIDATSPLPPDETATARVARWLSSLNGSLHWVVDLASGPCDPVTGEALFHLIERARSAGAGLLIAWSCPDQELAPPELASRLRMMEKTPLYAPADDAALAAVLQSVAANLHWDIPATVLRVMLSHTERSLAHQLAVLRRLERESRSDAVRTTQRWVRENLNADEDDR